MGDSKQPMCIEQMGSFDHLFFRMLNKDATNDCERYQMVSHTSWELYMTMIIILLICRAYLSTLHIRVAMFVLKKRSDKRHSICFGLPLTTTFELIHTVMLFVIFIMFGVVENITAIQACAMFGVTTSVFIFSFILSTLKTINLGLRVLPKSFQNDEGFGDTIYSDKIIFVLFLIMIACEICSPILTGIVGPTTNNLTIAKIGILLSGITVGTGILIVARQGSRLITYIKASSNAVKHLQTPNHQEGDTIQDNKLMQREGQIHRMIRRMNNRTLTLIISGMPQVVLLILCGGGVIPFHWYYAWSILMGATIASFVSTLMYMPRGMSLFLICTLVINKGQQKDSDQRKLRDPIKTPTKPSSSNTTRKVKADNEDEDDKKKSALLTVSTFPAHNV